MVARESAHRDTTAVGQHTLSRCNIQLLRYLRHIVAHDLHEFTDTIQDDTVGVRVLRLTIIVP